MNIALWAGFITSLLLISNIDGGRIKSSGKIHSRPPTNHYSSHHSSSYHNTYHPAPPSQVVVVPSNGGYQKSSFSNSLASGFGQGVGFGVGQQAVKSVFSGSSSGSFHTVNHVYTNQAAPGVLAPSSGQSVTVVQTEEKKGFPVIYIIIIVIGCIVASIVLLLLIKLLGK
ncbi:GSCOCG00005978001-RA-CDS [Cotesia congregata]|uniref:Uncharacterized protein n=1 Tax=Cotesia congregata TaxID=51543 RepID=A0A8J2HMW9_COTCN|nr:GSCOCG00005978001-RA-CDS [Cotesia congregata]CAG5106446.1 Protein of unknown function [Cotesia congregata]